MVNEITRRQWQCPCGIKTWNRSYYDTHNCPYRGPIEAPNTEEVRVARLIHTDFAAIGTVAIPEMLLQAWATNERQP